MDFARCTNAAEESRPPLAHDEELVADVDPRAALDPVAVDPSREDPVAGRGPQGAQTQGHGGQGRRAGGDEPSPTLDAGPLRDALAQASVRLTVLAQDPGVVAMVHSSATQWRHQFRLEITLTDGAIVLGGILSGSKSYVPEVSRHRIRTEKPNGDEPVAAAEAAIANPLIDDVSLKGAKGLIINITGGKDITLYEVDEAANRIKQEVDDEANIIYGTTCDERLEGLVRVSIVATGIDVNSSIIPKPLETFSHISIDNSVYQKNESVELIDKENIAVNENIQSSSNSDQSEINDSENISNLNESESSSTNDEITEDNQQIAKEEISSDYNNEKDGHIDENMTNNDIDHDQSEAEKSQASVKRLSLFDTVEQEVENLSNQQEERTEPVISESDKEIQNHDMNNSEKDPEAEFNAEESENDLDEEFNQETEEELLDIPTFLRRQAN